jgi:peroxiredoxin
LQEIVADLKSHGAHLVVISPQLEKYSRQVVKKHQLSFSVLSDRSNDVASKFGLTFTLPAQLKELYAKWGINLERFNGDRSWTLPLPGRFIMDRHGTIIHVDVHPDYTRRPEPMDIVSILNSNG